MAINKTSALETLDQARQKMADALADIPKEQEIYPLWTVKEILAHIIGWDEALTTSLNRFLGAEDIPLAAARGVDHYNSESVATRQALSLEQIQGEWQHARQELKTLLERLSDEQLQQEMLAPWGGSYAIGQLVVFMAAHESQHADDIINLKSAPEDGHFHQH